MRIRILLRESPLHGTLAEVHSDVPGLKSPFSNAFIMQLAVGLENSSILADSSFPFYPRNLEALFKHLAFSGKRACRRLPDPNRTFPE
jgi:hypothetical protein